MSNFNGEQVDLKYRDYRDNSQKRMQLRASKLIRRFVLHVPPRGFMRVRYYGYLTNAVRRKKLKEIRSAILTEIDNSEDRETLIAPACP